MRTAVAVILSFATGTLFGVAFFGYTKHLLQFPIVLTILPSVMMFAVGFLIRTEKKVEFRYKPYFHGSVQSLGSDGDKIVMSAMKRVGLVREKR